MSTKLAHGAAEAQAALAAACAAYISAYNTPYIGAYTAAEDAAEAVRPSRAAGYILALTKAAADATYIEAGAQAAYRSNPAADAARAAYDATYDAATEVAE